MEESTFVRHGTVLWIVMAKLLWPPRSTLFISYVRNCVSILLGNHCFDFAVAPVESACHSYSVLKEIITKYWLLPVFIRELKHARFWGADGTGRELFARKESDVSQIFILIIPYGEKVLRKVDVVVWRQVKRENSSLPFAVRVSKMSVLKLPIILIEACHVH